MSTTSSEQPHEQESSTSHEVQETATVVDPDTVDALPEFAQKIIKSLRSEAATHRHKTRIAEEKSTALEQEHAAMHAAKTSAESALATARMDLVRLRAALAAGVRSEVAEDFAARLHGSSEDEVRADAERLNKTFSQRRGDPSQGAQGSAITTDHPMTNFFLSRRT